MIFGDVLHLGERVVDPAPARKRMVVIRVLCPHQARDDMHELLSATPEPVATKSLPPPVQIASFEA